ncbi:MULTISPECIES: M20/M25/M40 family metallo-hydrolase [unclassified Paenibacillus]|uniref:M20/M25/M40 family metallo-hydrolase n=1 Tax=unclassified Paenibacillus TaxID=185978 RepID=UPI002404E1A2|nr:MULTISPECIES: M20/M25/M40 family metallo-hydrolase [unclassified Paenibacillus]MDF9840445.1 tripeptide aminopeptidase [Paenibacillus sp. PastF-2]MDF9847027.1 tripeptide aminopeptidase [Paenibacillus sp. PastM-2]MDF9853599.1 tripeptide aminopeptidase [Paenibacillus sp. PastF-1]MDH6478915.1 tripeptide aminopeptidase [Paenibacillus sp. PastH-2]MDH6506647.1 tripeptide aminopeptidase [Paenibacillus sp. PastM-3]
MIVRDRLIQEFMELVQVDSETGNERQIADVLKEKFSALGLTAIEDNSMERTGHGAGNLFVTWAADSGSAAPKLLFTCHMDTVVPGKSIKPSLGEDGWITSDGTTILGSDDKAGLAALFEAIRVIQEQNIPHGQIQFVITAGEESGLLGARAMDASHLDAEMGFALDSNGEVGAIAVAAPTQARITMQIFGKSAHAGVNPEDGISAIQVASKAISAMKLGRIDKETTANIGKFAGGGPTNVVCDHVQLDAEARSIVQEKVELQIASMREALETTVREYGAECEFRSEIIYPAFSFNENDPVVQLAGRAISSLGLTTRLFPSGGGSDANVFNGLKVPTVNLAIGYEHIHTTKERIKADDIVKAAELVVAIVKESVKA